MDGMTETIILKYTDYVYYDIEEDRMTLRLMATTPQGTYLADIPDEPGEKNRERRAAFNDYVLGAIAMKIHPHEVTIG
jgi:hypothetical protein